MRRLNHVGDWGTQFGILIHHLLTSPEYCDVVKVPDEELYASVRLALSIETLMRCYLDSKALFDEDSNDFRCRSRLSVVSL